MALFFKECKTIGKSIIYIVFILAMFLFYDTQIGNYTKDDVAQYNSYAEIPEGVPFSSPAPIYNNPLIKPREGEESYGFKYEEVPQEIMTTVIASLVLDWNQNNYLIYPPPIYIGRHAKLNDKKQAEIAQIITDTTGVNVKEVLDIVIAKNVEATDDSPPTNEVYFSQIRYSDVIPIVITYDEYKEKMKQVDKILGGGYSESTFSMNETVPKTYEEALSEYNESVSYDKTSGAYARLFCDYMGILAALLSVFVPVAFLMRDRRAKANEVIFSRNISSVKFISVRYIAMVFMMVVPFILLSLIPSIYLIKFGFDNNLPVDIFAFVKYIIVWILPTLMTTTAVAFIVTAITDTPLAIVIQFLWSFISVAVGAFAAYGGNTGDLIHYGMNLILRHNTLDNLQYYRDNLTQIAINRSFYAILSIALVALTIFIYEQKRRGEVDVLGSLRKIFRSRKSAD